MDDDSLSADQLLLLTALASNRSAAAAAEQLDMKLTTFARRMVEIRAKLHVDSTKAALATVRARGLI